MPVLHPSHGGCEGSNHGADFKISDFTTAYITPAKAMAWTLVDLLADDAARARKVLADFRPQFTRDELVAHARGLTRHERTGY
jgi:hypothetical protein